VKTHELADFLDHLRAGLDAGLTAPTKVAFQEAASAFREIPNQTLKAFVKQIQDRPSTNGSGSGRAAAVDVGKLIERINRVRAGQESAEAAMEEVKKLKAAGLEEILVNFAQPKAGTIPIKVEKIRKLLIPQAPTSNGHAKHNTADDDALIEQGLQLYRRLRDSNDLSIEDIRSQFRPVFQYPKSVVEEILRRLDLTPDGTREAMANHLLSILEGLKMSRLKSEWILSGR